MQAVLQIIKSKSFSSLIGNRLGAFLGVVTFAILAPILPKNIFGPYIIEMPLPSFAVTALPQFSRQFALGNYGASKYEFERKAGMVSYLLLPLSMLVTINKPHLNFYKVVVMLLVNIISYFITIALFNNVESVAFVSTATFLAGIIFGYYHLKKHMDISFRSMLNLGWIDYKVYIV
jgi:O-antigen/teichoic acid export membrane protein